LPGFSTWKAPEASTPRTPHAQNACLLKAKEEDFLNSADAPKNIKVTVPQFVLRRKLSPTFCASPASLFVLRISALIALRGPILDFMLRRVLAFRMESPASPVTIDDIERFMVIVDLRCPDERLREPFLEALRDLLFLHREGHDVRAALQHVGTSFRQLSKMRLEQETALATTIEGMQKSYRGLLGTVGRCFKQRGRPFVSFKVSSGTSINVRSTSLRNSSARCDQRPVD